MTGRWVIVAEGREGRPNEFRLSDRSSGAGDICPFCPSHEALTTPEVAATGRADGAEPGTPGWRVRVFGNMYPALRPDATGPAEPLPQAAAGLADLYRWQPGLGEHEVVVYSPDHDDSLASVTPEHLAEILVVVRDRCRALAGRGRYRYVLPFCNHGPAAGATLAHPHLQIIATPEVPLLVAEKARRLEAYRRRRQSCLLCDLIAGEAADGKRVVVADEAWLVWTPWASRSPWEMCLAPRRHQDDFTQVAAEDLAGAARVLSASLRALTKLHDDPPLNLVLHSAPLAPSAANAYGSGEDTEAELGSIAGFHWHIEVLPRLTRLAGFEAGTGFAINSVAPETAARRLREEGLRSCGF